MSPKTISVGESIAAYSHGKVVGNLLFTSGITCHDAETGAVRGDTVEEQTNLSLDLLEAILAKAGSSLRDLLQVQVFLHDINRDFAAFDAAYKARIPAPYPPRATVGATLPGYLLEMVVTAYVGGED